MTVAFQRMFGILERWNNNQATPSLSKPHELSYRSNNYAFGSSKFYLLQEIKHKYLFKLGHNVKVLTSSDSSRL